MRKLIKSTVCFAFTLVLMLLVSVFPMMANATELGINENKDYILLLDCSGTMAEYDPDRLCAAACKQFIDQVPIENARIGVVAFGYDEPNNPGYQLDIEENDKTGRYVHEVIPLQETTTVKNTEGLKEIIDDVTAKRGDATPIGMAMLSAMDVLEKGGATDDNACIVLITDGNIAAGLHGGDFTKDRVHVDTAVQKAKDRGWKLFSIQMNSGNKYGENSEETKMMRMLAEETGVEDFGYVNVQDFSKGNLDINIAIASIITYMNGNGTITEPVFLELPTTVDVNVDNMTSECNITLLGNNIHKVTMTYPDGAVREITGDIAEGNLVASWEENNKNIKLIVPNEGTYSLYVEGSDEGDMAAVLFSYVVMDPDLVMVSDLPEGDDVILSKDQKINFEAHFTYHDIDILNNRYYEEHPAELIITSDLGNKQNFVMDASPSGYAYSLSLHELGSGQAFTAQIWLPDNRFIGGGEYSNPILFKTQNLLSEIINSDIADQHAYINGNFEPIFLEEYVSNPDGDALSCILDCSNDGNAKLEYYIENNYLNIACGLIPGTYEMHLTVQEPGVAETLVFDPFTLTVEDRPITVDEIPEIEVWSDYIPYLQEPGNLSAEIDFNDYFADPDGLGLTFSDVQCADQDTIIHMDFANHVLNIQPVEKGETEITFLVNDGPDGGTPAISAKVTVKVISGIQKYFAENWWWMALAVIALIVLILVIIILLKNQRVKGVWSIVITDYYGARTEVNELHMKNTSAGKKKTVSVYKLLAEICTWLPNAENISLKLGEYFESAQAQKMQLKGVIFGCGGVLENIPADLNRVEISYNGVLIDVSKNRKLAVKSGTLRIILKKETGEQMTIEMHV